MSNKPEVTPEEEVTVAKNRYPVRETRGKAPDRLGSWRYSSYSSFEEEEEVKGDAMELGEAGGGGKGDGAGAQDYHTPTIKERISQLQKSRISEELPL